MKVKRKTTEFALVQCELGSNHYLIDLSTNDKSPFFNQSSQLWIRLRYPNLSPAKEFNKIAKACIKTKETDLMIVKENLDN